MHDRDDSVSTAAPAKNGVPRAPTPDDDLFEDAVERLSVPPSPASKRSLAPLAAPKSDGDLEAMANGHAQPQGQGSPPSPARLDRRHTASLVEFAMR